MPNSSAISFIASGYWINL